MLLALALGACARNAPGAPPAPEAVEPAAAYTAADVPVLLRGSFPPAVVQSIGGGSHLAVDASFAARLGDVPLREVRWRDASTLSAVVPAGLPDGVYRLVVDGPFGSGAREAAFRASSLAPAQLAATAQAPARVDVGDAFEVRVAVTNTGAMAALQVTGGAARATEGAIELVRAPSGLASLAPGASGTLVWRLRATAAGRLSLALPVSARDALDGRALAATASAAAEVLTPAQLVATPLPPPASVDVGQPFPLAVDVANRGSSAATAVRFAPPAGFEIVAAPAAQDLAGGASARFGWTLRGAAPGAVRPRAAGTGTDATNGAAASVDASWSEVLVQTPAALAALARVAPQRAAIGQEIDVAMTVANAGGARAALDRFALSLAGSGAATLLQAPAPTVVPGGGSVQLVWRYRAAGSGSLSFAPSATGTAPNTGAALALSPPPPPPVLIETGAALAASATGPARVSTGQLFSITLTVANAGEAAALAVLPSAPAIAGPLSPLSSPGAQDIAGGGSAAFVWTYRATGEGLATWSAAASGVDADSGLPVAAAPASLAVTLERAATLEIRSFALPASLSRGQAFTASLVVANRGDATAASLSSPAPAIVATGGAAATLVAVNGPTAIAGGSTATLTYSYAESGIGPGSLSLSASVAAIDGNSGAAIAAGPARTATAAVQTPASLSVASFALPQSVSRGQTFAATLVVANGGGALARNVAPGTPAILATGGAAATLVSAPAAQDIAGNTSATFVWSWRESGGAPGTLQLHAGAQGTDANSGSTVAAAPRDSSVATVQAAAALEIASISLPSALSRGQTFAVQVVVANRGQAAATGVLPSAPAAIATGGAAASLSSSPAAVSLAGGASTSFRYVFVESGSGTGTLAFASAAAGTDANSGAALSSPRVQSAAANVLTPAALAIQSFAIPSALSAGQRFVASLVAINTGQTPALAVLPEPPLVTGTGASIVSGPSAADLAPGASATFTWTFAEADAGPGTLLLSTSIHGTDASSGASLTAGPASSNIASVVDPARLVVSSFTLPAALSRGQSFTATMVVQNKGGAAALGVRGMPDPPTLQAKGLAGATAALSPAAADIPPGGSASFTWGFVENGTGTGSLQARGGVSGTDANSGSIVKASGASNDALVQAPAALAISSLAFSASTISRGQGFTATLTVRNTGEAAATGVSPIPAPPNQLLAGGASAVTSSAPAAVTIAGGASATFVWSYLENGGAPGSIALSTAAAGADANSGSTVSAPAATSSWLVVQEPAHLAVALSAPAAVSRGQGFAVTLSVTNTGQATARGVLPQPAQPAVSATGGAAATVSGAPVAVDLQAGATASFTWQLMEGGSAPGSLSISAGAQAKDANSGQTISATAPAATVMVQQPAALSASFSIPSALTRGQSFLATLVVANTGQATALAVLPAQPVQTAATSGAAASTSTAQKAVAIAGGASSSFTYGYLENGAAPGTLQLATDVSASDANTRASLKISAQTGIAAVSAPSQLALVAFTAQSPITALQAAFTVSMTLKNTGGTSMTGVLPSTPTVAATGAAGATTSTSFSPATLAPGASVTFTWAYAATGGPGTLTFTASASGVDSVSGSRTATAAAASNAVQVQTAPELSISSFTLPARLSRGQGFAVAMVVANTGQATARAVLPGAPVWLAGGGAAATLVAAPAAADIAGGSSATFQWTFAESGTAAGTLQLRAGAAGTDANSGAAVQAPEASSNVATVQRPAALSIASFSVRPTVSRGQTFSVAMVVTNAGDATARAVAPSALSIAATGPAAAGAPGPQAAVDVPGGQSATFQWTLVESGTGIGTLTFSAGAAGTDANSGASLSAPASSAATTVQRPAALSVASFTLRSSSDQTSIDRGQAFTAVLRVSNTGEATATGVLPTPLPPALSVTGGAAAATSTAVSAATIAGGASATFAWSYAENGAGPGSLTLSAAAEGKDGNSGAAAAAPSLSSNVLSVQAPPSLAITSFTIPSLLSRGQPFTATMVVANQGGATATLVAPGAPVLSAAGLAHATTSSSPARVAIAAGASASFSWSYVEDGTGGGTLLLSAGASGTDANTGAALSVAAQSTNTATVQRRAVLSAATVAAPARVSRGQSFAVTVSVANSGDGTASSVLPSPSPPSVSATGGALASTSTAASAATLAGGASASFKYTFVESGTDTGTLSFAAGSSGTDANSGAPIQGAPGSATTIVEKPAALVITSFTTLAKVIEQGQAFTAQMVVANVGEAAASNVAPSVPALGASGNADATTSSAPPPVGIAGGASATFTWSYVETGTGAGAITLTGDAAGTDANSSAALSAAAVTTAPLSVQTPPKLSATTTAPAAVYNGDLFAVTVSVANSGGTGVLSLAPSLRLSGTGAAALKSGPTPASASVTAGGSASFSWSFRATAAGAVAFAASGAGIDAITGATVSASAATVQTKIAELQTLATDPFSDGTSFSFLFSYQGQIYLGPDKSGAGAVRMNPDGSSPQRVAWRLEPEVGLSVSRNLAYQPPSAGGLGQVCRTIGAAGCALNTTACGPDNEGARALFFSGVLSGTEWYGVAGTSSPLGPASYVYLTNGTFPLAAGGADDLAYLNYQSAISASTRQLVSAHAFHDKLYLGLLDTGARAAPVLVELSTFPSLPGRDAGAGAVNLGANNLPGLGDQGSPANGRPVAMIDAIADFNDALYLANNGGWIRSTSNAPSACSSTSCSGWTSATPSAAAYAAETSVTVIGPGALEPAGRAVPAIVPFGGRLFAARNTTRGPQLWSCLPSAAGGTQCGPGDWSLIVRNSAAGLDANLSQFDDANNAAVTLLAASSAALFVGFNNSVAGVVLYRTGSAAASTRADFTGSMGCSAAATGCQGLGTSGLGAGAQRIYDSRVLSAGGVDFLYLSAGAAGGPVSVFRIAQ